MFEELGLIQNSSSNKFSQNDGHLLHFLQHILPQLKFFFLIKAWQSSPQLSNMLHLFFRGFGQILYEKSLHTHSVNWPSIQKFCRCRCRCRRTDARRFRTDKRTSYKNQDPNSPKVSTLIKKSAAAAWI